MNATIRGPSALRLAGLWMLALLSARGAPPANPVGVVGDLVLADAARGRQVPVKIYLPPPERPGACPVVIFSHGAGGSKDGYEYLGLFWAQNGYVVIHPDHAGSDRAILRNGRILAAMRTAVENRDNLVNRPLDISFVIDSLASIATRVPGLRDRMDLTRIGVAGHSFGAYTAMAVAGARIHLPGGETRTFGDPRVASFVAMSPQGTGNIGFAEDSWAPIARPMLTLSGSEDRELGGGAPSERLQPFRHMAPGGKFHVTLAGVTHMDFGDRRLDGTAAPEAYRELIKRVGLAFWETTLRRNDPTEAGFRRSLREAGVADSGAVLSASGATGELQSK